MLTIRHRLLCCAIMALCACAMPAAAADVNKYLPDDPDVVLVINVRQLLQAPLMQKYAPELLKKAVAADEQLKRAMTGLGFDPLKDLSTLTVASTGFGPDGKGTVIIEGVFDPVKFEMLAETATGKETTIKVLKEGDYKIIEFKYASEPKPTYAGIIDKTTIVMSSEKAQVIESFARAAGAKTGNLKKEMAALIEKANPNQSLWLVAPATAFSGQAQLFPDPNAAKILEKIDNLNLGLTLANNFKLAVAIVTKSADAAKEVSEQLNFLIEYIKGSLAASGDKKLEVLVDLVGALRVGNEGNTITLKSELSQEMIEKVEKILKSDAR